jgi:hypothetical protein
MNNNKKENTMNKYSFKVKIPAYKTVTVEAPNPKTAVDFIRETEDFYYGYGLADGWDIDSMDAEPDVFTDKEGRMHGVEILPDDEHCEYEVTPEWLKEAGYVATYTKKEKA